MKTENPGPETRRREEKPVPHGYDLNRIFAALREEGRQQADRPVRAPERRTPDETTTELRESLRRLN